MSTQKPHPPLLSEETTASSSAANKSKLRQNIFSGIRCNNRMMHQIRPIYIQTNYLKDAGGSAYFKIGETKIICAVYGPRPSNKSSFNQKVIIQLDVSTAAMVDTRYAMQEGERKNMSRLLLEALESFILVDRYPKSVIDVNVIILEDDGGLLSAALCCIGLALMDAHIEILDIIVGASIYAASPSDKQDTKTISLVDCDQQEQSAFIDDTSFTAIHVGMCYRRSAVCFLHAIGKQLTEATAADLFRVAEATCEVIGNEIQKHISNTSKLQYIKQ